MAKSLSSHLQTLQHQQNPRYMLSTLLTLMIYISTKNVSDFLQLHFLADFSLVGPFQTLFSLSLCFTNSRHLNLTNYFKTMLQRDAEELCKIIDLFSQQICYVIFQFVCVCRERCRGGKVELTLSSEKLLKPDTLAYDFDFCRIVEMFLFLLSLINTLFANLYQVSCLLL